MTHERDTEIVGAVADEGTLGDRRERGAVEREPVLRVQPDLHRRAHALAEVCRREGRAEHCRDDERAERDP